MPLTLFFVVLSNDIGTHTLNFNKILKENGGYPTNSHCCHYNYGGYLRVPTLGTAVCLCCS